MFRRKSNKKCSKSECNDIAKEKDTLRESVRDTIDYCTCKRFSVRKTSLHVSACAEHTIMIDVCLGMYVIHRLCIQKYVHIRKKLTCMVSWTLFYTNY